MRHSNWPKGIPIASGSFWWTLALKPRFIDYALLVYLTALAAAPALIKMNFFAAFAFLLLGLFPSALFILALALILLRAAVPGLNLSFGLSGAPWATIIMLLIMLGHWSFSHATVLRRLGQSLHLDETRRTWANLILDLPTTISIFAVLYALIAVFFCFPIGPKRNPKR